MLKIFKYIVEQTHYLTHLLIHLFQKIIFFLLFKFLCYYVLQNKYISILKKHNHKSYSIHLFSFVSFLFLNPQKKIQKYLCSGFFFVIVQIKNIVGIKCRSHIFIFFSFNIPIVFHPHICLL